MGAGYVWEKFHAALSTMMGEGPARQRLQYAAERLGRLKHEDFPDPEIQQRYEVLMAKLTAHHDEERGNYYASAQAMSDLELREVRDEILSLHRWAVVQDAE